MPGSVAPAKSPLIVYPVLGPVILLSKNNVAVHCPTAICSITPVMKVVSLLLNVASPLALSIKGPEVNSYPAVVAIPVVKL